MGSGQLIKIWEDPWLTCHFTNKVLTPIRILPSTSTVSVLIINQVEWNVDLIGRIFSVEESEATILSWVNREHKTCVEIQKMASTLFVVLIIFTNNWRAVSCAVILVETTLNISRHPFGNYKFLMPLRCFYGELAKIFYQTFKIWPKGKYLKTAYVQFMVYRRRLLDTLYGNALLHRISGAKAQWNFKKMH